MPKAGKPLPKKVRTRKKIPDTFVKKKKKLFDCLHKCLGIIKDTCKCCGISRETYYNWAKRYATIEREREKATEAGIDFAESQLFKLIAGYSHPEDKLHVIKGQVVSTRVIKHYTPDTAAIIFYLKTKGKHRGYVEREQQDSSKDPDQVPNEIELPGGQKIKI